VVQPRRGRPAAAIVDALLAHDLDPVVTTSEAEALPDPSACPLALILGTDPPRDSRAAARLERELKWIRRADEAGTKILGIGHGARALALAFGGSVAPAQRPLRAWTLVDTSVPHVIPAGPWLAWQHDVLTLPSGAVTLAHNRLGPQAFRLRGHLGVRFHPEATPEDVANWADGRDAAADVRSLLRVVKRDPAAASICAHRLLSSFIRDV
jgi:GMP synthase-like glutamine amidotransferase